MTMTFTVQPKGVGRRDNTSAIQRSVSHFMTPTLRQAQFTVAGTFLVSTLAWPWSFTYFWPMPQEDGGFDWEASSISVHYSEIWVATNKQTLTSVGLLRYASLDDVYAGIVAERGPQIFGYGSARMHFIKALPTQEGSVYGCIFGVWTDVPTVILSLGITGIAHDLTPPWMTS